MINLHFCTMINIFNLTALNVFVLLLFSLVCLFLPKILSVIFNLVTKCPIEIMEFVLTHVEMIKKNINDKINNNEVVDPWTLGIIIPIMLVFCTSTLTYYISQFQFQFQFQSQLFNINLAYVPALFLTFGSSIGLELLRSHLDMDRITLYTTSFIVNIIMYGIVGCYFESILICTISLSLFMFMLIFITGEIGDYHCVIILPIVIIATIIRIISDYQNALNLMPNILYVKTGGYVELFVPSALWIGTYILLYVYGIKNNSKRFILRLIASIFGVFVGIVLNIIPFVLAGFISVINCVCCMLLSGLK